METTESAGPATTGPDDEVHEGGCVCGAIRFRTTGQPANVIVCHCTWCQRRTGSGFAVIPKFTRAQFELVSGNLKHYRSISDESGRWLDLEFCPDCGTNIGFLQELRPDAHAIDAGTFDDPSWLAPDRQWFRYIFVRSSQAWSALPEGVEHHHGHFLDKEGPGLPLRSAGPGGLTAGIPAPARFPSRRRRHPPSAGGPAAPGTVSAAEPINRPNTRMTTQRRMHLGAFMRPVSIHTAWWRYPGGYPDANFNIEHLASFAKALERGCFDAFFMADHLAVLNMPMDALKRSATVTSFDPLTLLPALSMVTKHLGLIATASTTFEPPYLIARRFASLDHISGGRAGWNVVTTSNPEAALNFGMSDEMEHGERYRRAREFVDVVTGLWDSWADDAFIRDVQSGDFFDPAKMHVLDHEGEFFSVRGPLNIARPVQGWPVIVQAGASDAGRQLAAETAELIFTVAVTREAGRAFRSDVHARMERYGRDPAHMKILPAALVVVADSVEEARERRAHLDSLVNSDSAIAALSIALGHDASKFDPDGPLPEVPESNQSRSGRERAYALARRENLTVRQVAQRLGGFGGPSILGTPETIADEMEDWLTSGACDGFIVMFPYLPAGLEDFVDRVVPELQRRGILRREYEGATLRENLGLPRPANRFFS